jgi:hypothetical protein
VRVDLHPEARAEFRSSALWYDERRDGLGEEFVAAVDAALQRIGNTPQLYPRWVGTEKSAVTIRKAPVERFPHVIAFEEHERHLIVLAVAHQKRRPLYWGSPGLAESPANPSMEPPIGATKIGVPFRDAASRAPCGSSPGRYPAKAGHSRLLSSSRPPLTSRVSLTFRSITDTF